MNKGKRRTRRDRIDQLFSAWDKRTSPGCALAVMRAGRIVYKQGYGMANLDYGVPIKPTTVFHVASVSKQFTAMALALLEDEGKLSLDDDVREFIPEIPEFGRPITLRHLIHHTSGLRDQWDLLSLAGWRADDVKTDADVLALAARQRALNFWPGEEHLYSNTGYTLMGIVVSRVSGMSLRNFTEARIFEPLKMRSTHFHDDHTEVVKNRAYGYEPCDDGRFRISIPAFDTVGASSLFTTVEDLARWDRNFYEHRVGGRAVMEAMHVPGVLESGEALTYAFGLAIGADRGVRTVGHAGGDAGYRSHFLRVPDYRLAVAVLCNLSAMDPGRLARQVAEIFLAKQMRDEEGVAEEPEADGEVAGLAPEEIEAAAGAFRDPRTEEVRRLVVKDGRLWMVRGDREMELVPLGGGRFRAVGLPLRVSHEPAAEDSARARLHLHEGDRTRSFEVVPGDLPVPDDLAVYAGAYYSEDLDVTYTLALIDGRLVLQHRKSEPEPLTADSPDGFYGDRGLFRFSRDGEGRVDAFTLTTGRSRRIRFEKVG